MTAKGKKYFYLIHIQYLGYRYHGWFKQPDQRTVQKMIDKTLSFVLGHQDFKTLGCSRTDSKVSANHMAFELFVKEKIKLQPLLSDINANLPNDIRALKIEEVDETFNIIHAPKMKEYIYLFSFGEKPHPFSAPLIAAFNHDLDIELMKTGARLFEGTHNFKRYSTKPTAGTRFEREILLSKIEVNKLFTANFFPEKSYVYHVHGRGFMRYQVRLMMGQLLALGKGEIRLEELMESLNGNSAEPLRNIAPSSGLTLNKINFGK